jgi:hypothetical protein
MSRKGETAIRTLIIAAALGVVSVAPAAAQSPAAEPTPEAAAKFIDTVLASGVILRAAGLSETTSFSGAIKVEGGRTRNCKTVIFSPVRSDLNDRWRLEIDWRKFASAAPFFPPEVKDRWIVRVLASTTENLAGKDDIDRLDAAYETKQFIGAVVEPPTEEMQNRLIRAMEFYGKSCAPVIDGPF